MSKKEIFTGIFILLALVVFLNQDFFFTELPRRFFGPVRYKDETLRIVLSTEATNLSPYSLNLNNLIRTANVYEGLVAFDRSLRVVPALSVAWGNLDPLTWEFKLRREVTFHDGTLFTAQSVADSYESAIQNGGSQIRSLLNTIDRVEVVDDFTIRVITKNPDPLTLSKLAKFNIHHGDRVGTGPYTIKNWVQGEVFSLTAYPGYWGRAAIYRNVDYAVTRNRTQREANFQNGATDILVAVPRDQALELPEEQVKNSFSLEVNFMMFKLDDPLLQDRDTREAIRSVLDPAEIEAIGNFFVRQVSQFVAPGVFGFNPSIPLFEHNPENRTTDIFGAQRKRVTLDYLATYRTLTEYLQRQLTQVGFLVNTNEVSPDELLEKIKNNESQLFVIGWQAENGDAGDFLDAFIHSQGEFNNGRYRNAEVDRLIEASRSEINPGERLAELQRIMELVHEDLIGVPLFESSRLYAVQPGIEWEPRLDGLVLAAEVK